MEDEEVYRDATKISRKSVSLDLIRLNEVSESSNMKLSVDSLGLQEGAKERDVCDRSSSAGKNTKSISDGSNQL